MESMKEDFQRFKEHTARRGETISLQRIYTKLQFIRRPQIMEENEMEILNSGRRQVQNMQKTSDDCFPTTIQSLFDPDEDGFIPKIVVLQGPAGIGKTMTSRKIMLDWASGNLYKDKFDFVFHLSCRELNTISRKINLVGLFYRTCKLESSDDLVSILKDSQNRRKLLFIVDGFDELRWTLVVESEVCHDISEETDKEILLQRLLRKQLLKQSSLIINTRSMALEKLHSFVDDSRYVEVLGFTEEDRKVYFHKLFRNKDDADKALGIIKDNDILNTMCAVPIVCWIVCTVMKPQIKQDLDLLQYQTATSVYLLYLKGLIKYHGRNQPAQTCLKKLCALANEGVLNQQILFEVEDLNRHGLSLSEVESVFLNEKILNLDIDTQTYYSFIHLSVQEFLAALYYVLDDGAEGAIGLREDTSIPEICKGRSLSTMCIEHPHLTLAVRFLFGLLNEKEVKSFSKSTGINISLPARCGMQEWLLGDWLFPNISTGDSLAFHSTEAISCLYETQDKDTIRTIISRSSHLELLGTRKGGFWTGENCSIQLYYCLKTCERLQVLSFTHLILDPKYLEMLSTVIHRCHQLRINKLLTSLDLSDNKLRDSGVKILCEGLEDPGCTLQVLRIHQCYLTPMCCDDLCSLLITNRSLTSLDLSTNHLWDSGIKRLCEGLGDPDCTLQELNIKGCGLTPLSCDDLQSVLIANRSLIKLELSFNLLEDPGIKLIYEAFKHPGCTLQELRFDYLYTLETDTDVEISEADRCFEDLGHLGYTVEKNRVFKWIKQVEHGGLLLKGELAGVNLSGEEDRDKDGSTDKGGEARHPSTGEDGFGRKISFIQSPFCKLSICKTDCEFCN
ncbi:PREDICTED: NACHT, LRR and PYD domains-containing protein 12-like [Nanorana parkeri]|uniref:NACHT, LRR and PYD domains-containing protein 12-like n=1 Tax=Nanorana parkeri TaxID=125878 RepID=UPI00085437E1|nr:PREDICTED: NACHT, LRR and PYD domains-containing protein 12-like [Nanorana parkeri]